METVSYDLALSVIKDGDVIALRENTWHAPIIEFFTRSEYTHVGLAIWIMGDLWMAELNGGRNHLIPMLQLTETDFDVYRCPVDNVRARESILQSLHKRIDYAYITLAVIGLLNWLKIKVFLHARRLLVCSGYCVMVLEKAGWPERTRILSPRELVEMLELRITVRKTK